MSWNRLYRPLVLVGIWVFALGGPIALDAQNGSLTRLIGYVDPPRVSVDSGPDMAGRAPRSSQPTAADSSAPTTGPAASDAGNSPGWPGPSEAVVQPTGILPPDQDPRSSSGPSAPAAMPSEPPNAETAGTPTLAATQPAGNGASGRPTPEPGGQPAAPPAAPSQASALSPPFPEAPATAATPWPRAPILERPATPTNISKSKATGPAPVVSIDTPGSGSAILSKSSVVPGDHWSYDLVVRNSGNQPFNYLLSIKAASSSGLDAPETLGGSQPGLRLRVFRCAASFAICGAAFYDGPVAISALSVGFLTVRAEDSLRLELRLPAESTSAAKGLTSMLDLTWTAVGA